MPLIFKHIKFRRRFLILFLDMFSIALSCFLSYFIALKVKGHISFNWITDQRFVTFTLFMLITHPIFLYIFELYEIQKTFRKLYLFSFLIYSSFFTLAFFLLISRLFSIYIHSKTIVIYYFFIAASALYLKRFLFYNFITLPRKVRSNVIFIGTDVLTPGIVNELKKEDYNIIGVLSDEDESLGKIRDGLDVVSTGKNLGNLIRSKKIKVMIRSFNSRISLSVMKKIYKFKFKGVELYRSDSFYEILTRKFSIIPFLSDDTVPFPDLDAFIDPISKNTKRFMDVIGALSGLIVFSPVFLLVAILIKTTSKGPVFFFQERLGFQEKPFKLIKFRTMIHEAEKKNGPQWSSKNDSRITFIGKILRMTRLDELPQFINLIKGDISFVGPRPIRRHFAKIIEKKVPFYSLRFTVKPGLTGWAQVNYDYGGTVEGHIEKFQYDLYYIKHFSIILDLFIILKTFQTVIRKPGH